ncbi:MAG: AAA domain-containing protein [Chitinophagales bacterium]
MKQQTFPPITASHFYSLMLGIVTDKRQEQYHHKLFELNAVYTLLLKQLTKKEQQFFATAYSRSIFVFDYFRVPQNIVKPLFRLGALMRELFVDENYPISELQYVEAVSAVANAVCYFSNEPIPQQVTAVFAHLEQEETKNIENETAVIEKDVDFLPIVALHISEMLKTEDDKPYFKIIGQAEGIGKVCIFVWEKMSYLQKLVWKYARINFTNLKSKINKEETAESKLIYYTTATTLITLDPDFLVDASVIAMCRLRYSVNPIWNLLGNFTSMLANFYTLRGNMVNDYLDRYLIDNRTSPQELFAQSIQNKPLLALLFTHEDESKVIKEVAAHFLTIEHDFVRNYKQHDLSLEPTFLSEKYGLRGRLDVLVEYEKEPYRKDVIELKTSKDPQNYRMPIYPKDALQAVCYNLLISATNPDFTISSAILYSSAAPSQNPLRNAPNTITHQRQALFIRNCIAYYSYKLTIEPERILKFIDEKYFKANGLWDSQKLEIRHFRSVIYRASEVEKAYFYNFVKFIAREYRSAKVGNNNQRTNEGFATLWNQSLKEKELNYKVLAYLKFEKTVVQNGRKNLFFKKTKDKTIPISTFRQGDFILLFPQTVENSLQPTQHQVIKGTIQENGDDYLIISPLNQFMKESYFTKFKYWALEAELFELGFRAMYQSLHQFLSLSPKKKNLLLGLTPPQTIVPNFPFIAPPDIVLKDKQKEILAKALSAKNYFLLQGPPGTGKTKVMLRTLVMNLLQNPEEKILLLAYTNRAVDEMCEALTLIEPQPPFIRLGYSHSTVHTDALLSRKAKNKSLHEVRKSILTHRIYVSTVITYLRSPELRYKMRFTTAIVDEASQLLEPQIVGILGKVQRFILIGDEKQLPAVVTQSEDGVHTDSPLLHDIGIKDLCVSMFERMLKNCKEKAWHHAYDMLEHQGRMHQLIQDFPSQQYYAGKLQPFLPQQYAEMSDYSPYHSDFMKAVLGENRLVYIKTKSENKRNVNLEEAKITSWLIKEIRKMWGDKFSSKTLGVITPYRAQIAEIKSQLPQIWREEVTVDTVERYQGSQRDIIIISMAVNHVQQLDLLHVLSEDGTTDKKLNVALTRAKQHLILIGCESILQESPIYKPLLDFYSKNGKIITDTSAVFAEKTTAIF